MTQHYKLKSMRRIQIAACAAILGIAAEMPASAQTTPPASAPPAGGPPSPAKQAIDARKAIFTLIGSNFRPLGEVLQGRATYDAAETQKRAARLQFLAGLLDEAFPDISSTGDTRAKPEIWSNRADFDKKLKDFDSHIAALVQLAGRGQAGADDFKAVAGAVGQDCKSCHENYRTK